MTSGNLPVIVDFGLSVSDVQRAEGTARGEISGTPTYMSPEQAAGAGHRIDGRTEIYALGVILYRMLTGRLPFDSSSMMDLLRQVQEDEPQPPRQLNRHLPVEMERICLKAMAKSLKERYTTADDLAFELRQAIAGIGLAATANPAINSSLLASSATIHRPSVAELSPSDSVVGGAASESRRGKPSSSQSFDEHVSGSESSRSTPTSSRRRSVSQRRQVTIVSCGCDVFENETIQECLDADEQAGVLQGFQKLCREVAAKFNGSVLQDTDDGIAVCFGFPQAFEDSVSRAVRFGLAVLHKMVEHNRTLQTQKVRLSSRIVMHTDVAVVESQANSEDALSVSVVGTIRNYTSRLEQVAELDSLLVSEKTHSLLKGQFESETLGEQRIKGLPSPVALFRITQERSGASRVDRAEFAELTPLIGRDQEIGLLQERWEQAAEGMGQVVLIIGEAGLGKSRLVHSLKRHVLEQAHDNGDPIIEWRASQQRQNSSLYPAIECFERVLGFEREDTASTQLEKLVLHLRSVNLDGDLEVALIASLLSVPLNGQIPELNLPPQAQREQTTALLLDWLKELSIRQPLLFVIEDLR